MRQQLSNHPRIPVSFSNINTTALLDTGASVSLFTKDLYNRISNDPSSHIINHWSKISLFLQFKSASNTTMQPLHYVELPLTISISSIDHLMLLMPCLNHVF